MLVVHGVESKFLLIVIFDVDYVTAEERRPPAKLQSSRPDISEYSLEKGNHSSLPEKYCRILRAFYSLAAFFDRKVIIPLKVVFVESS